MGVHEAELASSALGSWAVFTIGLDRYFNLVEARYVYRDRAFGGLFITLFYFMVELCALDFASFTSSIVSISSGWFSWDSRHLGGLRVVKVHIDLWDANGASGIKPMAEACAH